MHLPNKLTIFRGFLIIPLIIIFYVDNFYGKLAALILFLIAVVTDIIDGLIARKKNIITDFGKLMDPLVDKILIISLLLVFVEIKLIPAWIVMIIIIREFLILGFRSLTAKEGKIIPANIWGKIKTGLQTITVTVILLLITLEYGTRGSPINNLIKTYINPISFWLMIVVMLVTVLSLFTYGFKIKEKL